MMEFIELFRVLRRRWWLIAIPVIITTILVIPSLLSNGTAISGGFTTQIRYSAAQEFNLPQREGDYQDVWLASELMINAFTDWVRSNSFRVELQNDVADEVDLGLLGIAADNARSVGVIYLSHPDQASLETISSTTIRVLVQQNQDYFPQLGGETAQVTILDQPVITAAPPPLTNRFAPLIRIGIAIILGLGLVALAEFIDPTIHHKDEIAKMGLPVLSSIPKHKA